MKQKQKLLGKTKTKTFDVPETYNAIEILSHFKKLTELPFLIQQALVITMIATFFYTNFSKWYYLVVFLFWRFCYNVGLGIALHFQSNYNSITNYFQKKIIAPEFCRFFESNYSTKSTTDKGSLLTNYPVEFNSWLYFRGFVDVILLCDTISYFIFLGAFAYIPKSFDEISGFQWILYSLGVFLVLFNIWVKIDSHRVIGDFAWYWGDFFFLVEKQLTFDGVFQMFPHPMYTVGYSYYYGFTLLTRSYTVLYASCFAHLCQLLFLYFVENPHIDKIYSSEQSEEEKRLKRILYDELKYFRKTGEPVTYYNFDFKRSSDLSTILLTTYSILIGIYVKDLTFHALHFVAWRLFHAVYLGLILHYQSTKRYWTQSYIQSGASKKESFQCWKNLYNMSLTMNNVVFVILFFNVYNIPILHIPFSEIKINEWIVKHIFGIILILLNFYATYSAYHTLGDMGWYYADFFLNDVPFKLNYTGLYRYLNDPYLIFGFASFYGMAIMSDSTLLLGLTMFAHFDHFVFNLTVERPHMKKLYGNKVVRKQGGLFHHIKKGIGLS